MGHKILSLFRRSRSYTAIAMEVSGNLFVELAKVMTLYEKSVK